MTNPFLEISYDNNYFFAFSDGSIFIASCYNL